MLNFIHFGGVNMVLMYPVASTSEERIKLLTYIKKHPDKIITFGEVSKATGLHRNRVRSLIDMALVEGWITRKQEVYRNNNYIRYSYQIPEGVKIR